MTLLSIKSRRNAPGSQKRIERLGQGHGQGPPRRLAMRCCCQKGDGLDEKKSMIEAWRLSMQVRARSPRQSRPTATCVAARVTADSSSSIATEVSARGKEGLCRCIGICETSHESNSKRSHAKISRRFRGLDLDDFFDPRTHIA